MSSVDTWMPLYVGRYLADTGHLTVEEHGAYFLLLMHYWCNGPLPDNDKQLATIARTDRKAWDKEVGPTLREFFVPKDGRLHQKRADIELAKAQDISAKKRAAAMTRHHGGGQNGSTPPAPASAPSSEMQSNSSADAMHMHEGCKQDGHPNDMPRARGLPLPSPLPREEGSEAIASGAAVASPLTPRDQLWSEGLTLLRSLTGQSEKPARAMLGKLVGLANDDCARVFNALWEASEAKPIDPTAWLMGAMRRRSSGTSVFLDPSLDEDFPMIPALPGRTNVH